MSNERFTVRNGNGKKPNGYNGPKISADLAAQLERLTDPTILAVILKMKDGAIAIVGEVVDPEYDCEVKARVVLSGDEVTERHSLHQGFLMPLRGWKEDEEGEADDCCDGEFAIPCVDDAADADDVADVADISPPADGEVSHRGGDVIVKRSVAEQVSGITHPAVHGIILECVSGLRAVIDVRRGMQKGIVIPEGYDFGDNIFLETDVEDEHELIARTRERFEPLAQAILYSLFEQLSSQVNVQDGNVSHLPVASTFEGAAFFEEAVLQQFCLTNGFEACIDHQYDHLRPRADAIEALIISVKLAFIEKVSEEFGPLFKTICISAFALNFNNQTGKFFVSYKAEFVKKTDRKGLSVCK